MATAMHNIDFSAFTTQDTDVDSWIDFSATDLQSPPLAAKAQGPSLSRMPSNAPSGITSPSTTTVGLDGSDEFQTPAKPSHEYERFKQQTGLPSGSVSGLTMGSSAFAGFSNSGIGLDESSLMGNWGSGLPMDEFPADTDFGSNNVPAYFFPGNEASSSSQQSTFVDPSSIQAEEAPANVRVWPGMHQQAALARAQQQAQQQRQQQVIQQQQQQRMELQRQQRAQQQQQQQQRTQASRRSASHTPIDARTEETIARVVSEMRHNSQLVAQQDAEEQDGLPHVMRMKKDEEDMDEDERLLASEEGKKLSSKERRQLRNKVSARAFRSRRKEYIGQLEGEVNGKAQEVVTLKQQNQALMEENARSRAFIEKLLRHPAFTPFLEELSRDESVKSRQPIQTQPAPATQAIAQQFQAAQPQQMQQDVRIGMTLVPEPPVDLSMLNLNGGWSSQSSAFGNFSQPHVFAVTEVPAGPINPIHIDVLSGKEYDFSTPSEESVSPVDTVKPEYPVLHAPAARDAVKAVKPAETAEDHEFDNDAAFSLYHASASAATSTLDFKLPHVLSGKPSHVELVVATPESSESAMERVERLCQAMDSVCERLTSMRS